MQFIKIQIYFKIKLSFFIFSELLETMRKPDSASVSKLPVSFTSRTVLKEKFLWHKTMRWSTKYFKNYLQYASFSLSGAFGGPADHNSIHLIDLIKILILFCFEITLCLFHDNVGYFCVLINIPPCSFLLQMYFLF